MSKLIVSDISISFGGLKALNSVSFDVKQGEIRGIIGPNGAGKTTMLNVISGINKADSGKITFDGTLLTGLKTNKIASKGIGRTFQATKLFKGMTVLENVMTGAHSQLHANPLSAAFSFPFVAKEEFMRMERFADHEATLLSFGQQRLVEIARVLVGQPQVLLLDEPAVGLSVTRVSEVEDLLKRIRQERGITIVMIEHVIRLVMGVCDRSTVLNSGEKIADGTADEVINNPAVERAYLGSKVNVTD